MYKLNFLQYKNMENLHIKDSLGKTVTIAVTVNSGSAVILSSLPAAGGGRPGERWRGRRQGRCATARQGPAGGGRCSRRDEETRRVPAIVAAPSSKAG